MNEHDAAIRAVLLPELRRTRRRGLVVQEWDLVGILDNGARVDVGVVNPWCVEAFEIKSARDSTAWLAHQAKVYSERFHFCTLVTTRNHMASAARLLSGPLSWWGLTLYEEGRLELARAPTLNPDARPERLLFSSELKKLTRELGQWSEARAIHREAAAHDIAYAASNGFVWRQPVSPYKSYLLRAIERYGSRADLDRRVCAMLLGRPDWRLPDGHSVLSQRRRERGF